MVGWTKEQLGGCIMSWFVDWKTEWLVVWAMQLLVVYIR
jgi:hypothetical protein